MTPPSFVALLPVKPLAHGKSRLSGLGPRDRAGLARAFALDTVAACLAVDAVGAVVVVTDDDEVSAAALALGAEVVPDPGGGLNAALTAVAAGLREHRPRARPVAVLADLPALRPSELAATLAAAPEGPAYVEDADGTGTTLYTASYDDFAPRFGPGSARAHAEVATSLAAGPSVRRDVDTAADWATARALGLGRHSAEAARSGAGVALDP